MRKNYRSGLSQSISPNLARQHSLPIGILVDNIKRYQGVTSCLTWYVVPILDSANEIFVRVFAQPCALGFQCRGNVASDKGIGVLLILK